MFALATELWRSLMDYSAGHETTGHTLAFTLAYLALHANVQEEMYAEFVEACGDAAPSESQSLGCRSRVLQGTEIAEFLFCCIAHIPGLIGRLSIVLILSQAYRDMNRLPLCLAAIY